VSALPAGRSAVYRRSWAREWLNDRFWVVPSVLLIGGVVLAVVTVQAGNLGVPQSWRGGVPVDPGEASALLGIIASSTLTFVGVVFTLTLVALQLASSQLSPRVLRMFVRSTVTKLAFGILLATFSYSIAFLVLEGGRGREADSRGVTAAMALVAASLVIFVAYVARTMKLLQVAWVITEVADETRKAIRHHFPPADAYIRAAPPVLSSGPAVISLPLQRRRRSSSGSLGVVQGVDNARLAELARRHDCVLELLVRVGEYVPAGGAVIAAHGGTPPRRAVLGGIRLGRARTLYQDPAFGIRQLVDIAIQALSPAVSQPTTAVQVIDRLEDIPLRIARSGPWSGLFASSDGEVRFVEQAMTWNQCLDLAFTEITSYGAASAQVARRLLAAYDALAAGAREHGDDVRARRVALLEESASRGVRHAVLRADAMGLG
jgi:uncharacterized membrane protein